MGHILTTEHSGRGPEVGPLALVVRRALLAARLGRVGRLRAAQARDERSPQAGGRDEEPRKKGIGRREVRGMSRVGLSDAQISPTYPRSLAFGPRPIRVQERTAMIADGEVNAPLGNQG